MSDRSLSERVKAAIAPGPMCRDCADHDGRCPYSGELCELSERADEIACAVSELEESSEQQLEACKAAYRSMTGDLTDGGPWRSESEVIVMLCDLLHGRKRTETEGE